MTMTPQQKRKKKLTIFVCATFGYMAVFVITGWVAYFMTHDVPDTLIQVGLGSGAVELAAAAAIEIFTGKRVKDE